MLTILLKISRNNWISLPYVTPKFNPEGTTASDIALTSTEPLMTDDAILCDVLDEEDSETIDDTDDVSNEPIYPQSSDVLVKRNHCIS